MQPFSFFLHPVLIFIMVLFFSKGMLQMWISIFAID